ncbi:LysR family transcriptional regulator [Bacillus spizizenii]|nr:LysR family transcriptional regulator [Bacillus spizizenii]MCY8305554.1 LysR family transcriptional regulator [Bacillus spizizenii]MCY8623269.1 LysR family transcriptional regulator [Bacillus spizizenii]MCY8629978.1 LysR family transcriptional regulator [Bacillus spizizenii]MCY8660645.1 LysR family transcriptional regulator [Bacillus spizizenii]
MELRDLQIFKSVAHHKSITGAAKELSYVQSNVTARIKQLENELKAPLFNHHKKGVSLSPEGRKKIEHVNKILKDVEKLKQAFLDSDVPSGILKIGTVETVRILPTILASYYKKYPNVDLSLEAGLTEELIIKVTNQELDGAFISGPIKNSILEQYDVYTEKLTLVTTNKTFNIEDFLTTPILVSNRGCGYRSRLEHWLQDEGLLPNRILEFNILETILNSVALGLGITVVPETAVMQLSAAGKVYCHPLPEEYSCIPTIFIRHKDAYLTNSMHSLLQTIAEHKNMSMS